MEQDESTKGKGDETQVTSPAPGAGTSDTAERKYSEQDVQKRISDERAKAGREKAQLTKQLADAQANAQTVQEQLESTQSRLDEIERQQREAKLDRSNPLSVSLFQKENALLDDRRKLDKERKDLELEKQRLEKAGKDLKEQSIRAIAEKHGVEVADLEALGTDNMEVLERYAKAVGKPPEGDNPPETPPDSGLGTGARGPLTVADAEAMSDEAYIERRKKELNPPTK